MRHRVAGRKLGRDTEHRRAMWRNMAVSLFTHGQITTTIPKAKSVKPFVEKLITAAKKGELASRRRVISELGGDPILIREQDDEDVPRNDYGELLREGGRRQGPRLVKYLFEEIAPRYQDRDGGYTRIIKLGRWRKGDGADLCVLQLVGEEEGGPQVAGQYSRRRQKANRRMERAAQLRKGRTGAAASASETAEATAQASDASDTEQEVAAEEPQQQQTADQQETDEDENQQS